jgi:hypothetical protein
MFASAGGSNSSASDLAASGLQAAAPANTSALPCYEDPDCRYTVDFSKEQQVRRIDPLGQLAAILLLLKVDTITIATTLWRTAQLAARSGYASQPQRIPML